MRSATSCHRCSAPVLPVASSCPWCGTTEPAGAPCTGPRLGGAVLGAWLLAGGVSLSVTTVLVDALTRALT